MTQLLQDYYESKIALEILTKEVEEKKEAVLAYLQTQPNHKASTDKAGFSVRVTPVYQFSDVVEKLSMEVESANNKLKEQKKAEIEQGVATVASESLAVVMTKAKL